MQQGRAKGASRRGLACRLSSGRLTAWAFSYLFMEFSNADDAARALLTMNGHAFDAKHTFLINRFTDFERYLNVDETYHEPPPEEYKAKVSLLCYATVSIGRLTLGAGTLACLARRSARP